MGKTIDYKTIVEKRKSVAKHNFQKFMNIALRELRKAKLKARDEEEFDFLESIKNEDINFVIAEIQEINGICYIPGTTFLQARIIKDEPKKFLWFKYKKRKEYVLCKIISMMVVNVELMKAFRFVDHTPYRLFFFRNTEEMDAGVLYQMELNPMPEASPMIAMIASE